MAENEQKTEAETKKKAPKAEGAKKAATKKPAAASASVEGKPAAAAQPKTAAPKAAPGPKRVPEKTVKVTQVRSPAGRFAYQRATLRGLGLDRINRSNVLEDTPAVRGMIERVKHLVRIEPTA